MRTRLSTVTLLAAMLTVPGCPEPTSFADAVEELGDALQDYVEETHEKCVDAIEDQMERCLDRWEDEPDAGVRAAKERACRDAADAQDRTWSATGQQALQARMEAWMLAKLADPDIAAWEQKTNEQRTAIKKAVIDGMKELLKEAVKTIAPALIGSVTSGAAHSQMLGQVVRHELLTHDAMSDIQVMAQVNGSFAPGTLTVLTIPPRSQVFLGFMPGFGATATVEGTITVDAAQSPTGEIWLYPVDAQLQLSNLPLEAVDSGINHLALSRFHAGNGVLDPSGRLSLPIQFDVTNDFISDGLLQVSLPLQGQVMPGQPLPLSFHGPTRQLFQPTLPPPAWRTYALGGEADGGGLVTLSLGSTSVSIPTLPGQSSEVLSAALHDAVRASPELADGGVGAMESVGVLSLIGYDLDALEIISTDAGIAVTRPFSACADAECPPCPLCGPPTLPPPPYFPGCQRGKNPMIGASAGPGFLLLALAAWRRRRNQG